MNANKSVFNPAYQNEHTDAKIVVALERVAEVFRVLLWNEGKETAISPIQIQILIFLRFHGVEKRTVSYLAREFAMTKATISDAVKVLEQKEFIEKRTQAHDSRSYVIHLTGKGKKRVEQALAFVTPMEEALTEVAQEQKEVLLASLLGLISSLHDKGVISVQRMCFSCRFYAGEHRGGKGHYCTLLGKPLHNSELRIDCPEHEYSEG